MTATLTTLLTRREQVRCELAECRRHLVSVIRDPEPELRSAPIGDVLSWCDGLDEAAVTRILTVARVNWGRRLSLLSMRDVAAVCWAIKTRHPEAWEQWREARGRGVAA